MYLFKNIVLLICCCVSIEMAYSQSTLRTFSISGKIVGLPDKVPIYVIRIKNGDTIAKVISRNAEFEILGSYENEGELHFLKFDSSGLGLSPNKPTWIRLYFDHQPIEISAVLSEWPKAQIVGSPSAELFNLLNEQIIAIHKHILDRRISGTDSIILLRETQMELLLKYPNELATAQLGRIAKGFTYLDLAKLYNSLSKRVQESYPGVMLEQRMNQRKPDNLIVIGNIVPDFTFIDLYGSTRKIAHEVKASRFTLIDFWASWCKPCIADIPTLKSVYNKYKRDDFQIISISIDRHMKAWKEKLDFINVTWNQGIDLDGNGASSIFGIGSIPAYLLLDSEGRMLAFYNAAGAYSSFGPVIKADNLASVLTTLIK